MERKHTYMATVMQIGQEMLILVDQQQAMYFSLHNYGTISWSSRKQPRVAKSSTKAEYDALSSATQEAIWLCPSMKDLAGFEINFFV